MKTKYDPILLHAKTRRKFDVDNRIKPILDALQGFVYSDDFQVDDVAVRRGIDPKQGYANVIIEKIGGKECKVQKRSTNTKTLTAEPLPSHPIPGQRVQETEEGDEW